MRHAATRWWGNLFFFFFFFITFSGIGQKRSVEDSLGGDMKV